MFRGKGTYYVYDGAHKDRGMRMCVCVCVSWIFPNISICSEGKKQNIKMGYKMVGVRKVITWVDLVSFRPYSSSICISLELLCNKRTEEVCEEEILTDG